MLIRDIKPWHLKENEATPEDVFLSRRKAIGILGGAAASTLIGGSLASAREPEADPTADLYPKPRNESFVLDRDVTAEGYSATYNNFYEFGSHKRIASAAQKLHLRPWTVEVDGLCEVPKTFDIDDLIRSMPLEERLYRHRCVERWAMAVPWTGFPLKALLDQVRPLSSAKFVEMQTFHLPRIATGQKQNWYPWPYVEGLSIKEAENDLAFMVTGVYGKALAKQFGSPLRLAVPWKYGFKSIKSIVRITLTDRQPVSFWEEVQPNEYGFWANVNPEVPHRRWSQAVEEMLGTGEKRPTQLYNGYGDEVAHLYSDMTQQKIFY